MRFGFVVLGDLLTAGVPCCAGVAAQGVHPVGVGIGRVIGLRFRLTAPGAGFALQLLPGEGVFDVVVCPSLFAGTGDEAVTDEEGPGDA